MGRGVGDNTIGINDIGTETGRKAEDNPFREKWLRTFKKSEERATNGGERGPGIQKGNPSKLLELLEFDRQFTTRKRTYYGDLYESIKMYGVGDAVVIAYNPSTRIAYLAEGNHRVIIANQLGIDKIPVRVNISSSDPSSSDPSCLGGKYISKEVNTESGRVLIEDLLG